MISAHRTFGTVLVWLAALLTLGSSVPQLTCVCPDGHVQPFCLSVLPGLAGCCCAGRTPAAPSERPCCAARRRSADKHPSRSQAERTLCRKTLTPSGVAAVSSSPTDARPAGDLSAPALVFAVDFGAGRLTGTSEARRGRRPPPPDLTVALQRLVI